LQGLQRQLMAKTTLDRIQLKEIAPEQAITSGELKVEGKREAFVDFVSMPDTFPFWFNIVTR
jgi:alkyl sulfatase BDS1-like metallo-beta-lactamase superfamily hydrolase